MEEQQFESPVQKLLDTATQTLQNHQHWNVELLRKWEAFHSGVVKKGDEWLDRAASFEMTSPSHAQNSWKESMEELKDFVSLPKFVSYQHAMIAAYSDGLKGLQSVGYAVWMVVQPILYSLGFILWRVVQQVLGKFLPTIQYIAIESIRFHLHLSWRQGLGEVVFFVCLVGLYKLSKFLRRKKYARRIRLYVKRQIDRMTKTTQYAFEEIAQISVLFAMAIPHSLFACAVVGLKLLFPTWVTWLATESYAPFLLKWFYPCTATIVVLHYARDKYETMATHHFMDDEDDNSIMESPVKDAKTASLQPTKQRKEKEQKKGAKLLSKIYPKTHPDDAPKTRTTKKNKRRRSSLGALVRGSAPGVVVEGGEVVYALQEINADIDYWLHFWCLRASLLIVYTLFSYAVLMGNFITSSRVHAPLCQLDLLFFMWIIWVPEMFLTLYPNHTEQDTRQWSKSKRFLFECASTPMRALATLSKPAVITAFEKISRAIPSSWWKKAVVQWIEMVLGGFAMMKMISPSTRDTLSEFTRHFRSLLLPMALLFMPGFFTQYGVCYVQYVIPLAYSFRALHRDQRYHQRVLYLKFWVLNAFATGAFGFIRYFFGWFPLFTHATFLAWVLLIMPKAIYATYDELDRELQAFGLLPKFHDDVTLEKTHTVKALTYVVKMIPTASDADKGTSQTRSIHDEFEGAGSAKAGDSKRSPKDASTLPGANGNKNEEESVKKQEEEPESSSSKNAKKSSVEGGENDSDQDENPSKSKGSTRSGRQKAA